MDNPAAILTDDVIDWSTSPLSSAHPIPNSSTSIKSNDNQPPQQHYRRNASTYSIDIPATMELMVTNSIPAINGGSTMPNT